MVLGFILSNKCAKLPLSYYIIFINPHIIIKIVGYYNIENGGKVL